MYGGIGLIANLVRFHNTTHSDHEPGYYCYVPLPNNILLYTHLEDNYYALNRLRSTRVFVQIPGETHGIYTGILEPMPHFRPSWLPRENLRSRPRH